MGCSSKGRLSFFVEGNFVSFSEPFCFCREVPTKLFCGLAQPAPAVIFVGRFLQNRFAGRLPAPAPRGPFPIARKWTKGAPKTSWFLDFQRRGSCLTPFEPPYSQESYDNDVTTCCPKRQVQNLTSARWWSRQGERTSLCEVPEGVSLLCKSSENGLCPFSGSHTKK